MAFEETVDVQKQPVEETRDTRDRDEAIVAKVQELFDKVCLHRLIRRVPSLSQLVVRRKDKKGSIEVAPRFAYQTAAPANACPGRIIYSSIPS